MQAKYLHGECMLNFEKMLVASGLFLIHLTGCATSGITRTSHFKVERDLVYKTVEGAELSGDLYRPLLPGSKPAVIVVHGGGWTSRGGRMTQVAEDLAGSGFVVFNVTYRLAPDSLYPKAIDDIRDAVRFAEAHAAQFEIDPARISIWGYSAGAHLALMVGLNPENHLKSIVAGGTPADFLAWPHSPIVRKFIGFTLDERPDLWKEASPVNHVRANSPPVFLYHGDKDQLVEVEQMDKMKSALEKKNVPAETHRVANLGHIPVYLFSEESIALGVQFIQRRVTLPASARNP